MSDTKRFPVRFITGNGVLDPLPMLSKSQIRRLVKQYRRWRLAGEPNGAEWSASTPDGAHSWRVPFDDLLIVQIEKGTGSETLKL